MLSQKNVFFVVLLVAFMVTAMAAPTQVAADSPVHNITQDTHHDTIQEAIDAANDGDIIMVSPGTYQENLVIERPLSIIGSGGSGVTVVMANDPDQEILMVSGEEGDPLADVTVQGFTFSGAEIDPDGTWVTGVRLLHVEDSFFEDILITEIGGVAANEVSGLLISGGGSNTFTDITVDGMEGINFNWGLRLSATTGNQFTGITVRNLTDPHSTLLHTTGIYMTSNSHNNSFTGTSFENLSSSRTTHVIWLANSSNNTFFNTNISDIHGDRQTSGVMLEHGSAENSFIDTTLTDMTTSDPGLIVVGLHTQSNAGAGNQFLGAEMRRFSGPSLIRGFSLHSPETVFRNIDVDFSDYDGPATTRAGQVALAGSGEISGGRLAGSDTGLFIAGSTADTDVLIEGIYFENNLVQVHDASELFDIQELLDDNSYDRALVVRDSDGNIVQPFIFSFIRDAVEAAESGQQVVIKSGDYGERQIDPDTMDLEGIVLIFEVPGQLYLEMPAEILPNHRLTLSLDYKDLAPPAGFEIFSDILTISVRDDDTLPVDFLGNMSMMFFYDPAAVPYTDTLGIYWYDGTTWVKLDSTVDAENGVIFTETQLTGQFALMDEAPEPEPEPEIPETGTGIMWLLVMGITALAGGALTLTVGKTRK